jgi:SET domain-containing protein
VSAPVEVRGSRVHGMGVFATGPIAAGTPVVEQEGVVVREADLPPDPKALQIGPDLWLLARAGEVHPSDEVNHACDPNTGFVAGDLVLVALRDIAPGEEITFDYATAMNEAGWQIPCRCGGPTCRGTIRAWCDLDAATRARLRPTALAWLRDLP